MSDSAQQQGGGYTPPKLKAPSFTFSQFQEMAQFFKQYLEESSLKNWIILAGVGGLIELGHTVWLAIRWIWKF